jgi:predicted nucleotidyltransferase
MGLLETYKDQIQRLCKNHRVKTLYSFGSVNTQKFTSDSDVDLMVDFAINDPIEYTDNYFDLKFELERILNRSIDLLENKAIKNPFLRENIDRSKVLIYGQ